MLHNLTRGKLLRSLKQTRTQLQCHARGRSASHYVWVCTDACPLIYFQPHPPSAHTLVAHHRMALVLRCAAQIPCAGRGSRGGSPSADDETLEPPFVIKLVVNCDATRVAAALSDGRVRLFDAATLGHVGDLDATKGSSGTLRDVVFAGADPTRIWTCVSGGVISLWSCGTGSVLTSIACVPVRARVMDDREGVYNGPFALATTAAGDVLAVGVAHEIQLWDTRGLAGVGAATAAAAPASVPLLGIYSESHAHTQPSYGTVRHLAFHPVLAHTLVSAGDDGVVNVFDTSVRGEDDALVSVLSVGGGLADMGFFSGSSVLLWALSEQGGLSIWNVATADRLSDLPALRMQFLNAGLRGCQVGNRAVSHTRFSSLLEMCVCACVCLHDDFISPFVFCSAPAVPSDVPGVGPRVQHARAGGRLPRGGAHNIRRGARQRDPALLLLLPHECRAKPRRRRRREAPWPLQHGPCSLCGGGGSGWQRQ